jgi:hypothetical protein
MKKHITIGGAILMLAAGTVWGADETNAVQSPTNCQNPDDIFRANELSLDLFGTDALGEHTISHPSESRIRHDSRLGAGLGLNYFANRYIGIGAAAYTENTAHNFVDNVSGSLILRLPFDPIRLAPYAFGGGGHQFDPVDSNFAHAGAGLEFRFTHNLGIFVDGRWVWTDRDKDYGLARAGFRIAF